MRPLWLAVLLLGCGKGSLDYPGPTPTPGPSPLADAGRTAAPSPPPPPDAAAPAPDVAPLVWTPDAIGLVIERSPSYGPVVPIICTATARFTFTPASGLLTWGVCGSTYDAPVFDQGQRVLGAPDQQLVFEALAFVAPRARERCIPDAGSVILTVSTAAGETRYFDSYGHCGDDAHVLDNVSAVLETVTRLAHH